MLFLLLWIIYAHPHPNITGEWWPSYEADMEAYLQTLNPNFTAVSPVDLRVSKACGPEYNKVRISAITQSHHAPSGIKWDYSSQFKWKWTGNYIHSKMITINPGEATKLLIDNNVVNIEIPTKGKETGGILFADICLSQDSKYCIYGGRWKVKERSTKFLNAVMKESGMHWWYIIGDNFYDQKGSTTKSYFDLLSLDAKRKCSGVVMGNHDYWNGGSAGSGRSSDNLGIGQTQWYAVDSAWSLKNGGRTPFDLSKNPNGHERSSTPPLNPDNNIWWHQMGNIGLLGVSGAFKFESYQNYFDQACQQFMSDNVVHVLVLTHWDGRNLGCQYNMDAPSLLRKLKTYGNCRSLSNKMHYVDGHTHCNHNWDKKNGFMIGGNGFTDSGQCGRDGAQFGHLYVKSTDAGAVQLWYFKFATKSNSNMFDGVYNCITANGIDGCLQDHATLWWSNDGPSPGPGPSPSPGPSPPTHKCCCYRGNCINDDWCNQSEVHCMGKCNPKHDKSWGC